MDKGLHIGVNTPADTWVGSWSGSNKGVMRLETNGGAAHL